MKTILLISVLFFTNIAHALDMTDLYFDYKQLYDCAGTYDYLVLLHHDANENEIALKYADDAHRIYNYSLMYIHNTTKIKQQKAKQRWMDKAAHRTKQIQKHENDLTGIINECDHVLDIVQKQTGVLVYMSEIYQ